MKSYCIPPNLVGKFWPHVAPLIRRAMERVGFSSFDDLERDVFNEYALLWVHWNGERITAAAITQAFGDTCTIVACGGEDRKDWIAAEKTMGEYAKANGCSRMRIIGRKGWSRVLPDYKQTCVVLERKL